MKGTSGIKVIYKYSTNEEILKFHYTVVPNICLTYSNSCKEALILLNRRVYFPPSLQAIITKSFLSD